MPKDPEARRPRRSGRAGPARVAPPRRSWASNRRRRPRRRSARARSPLRRRALRRRWRPPPPARPRARSPTPDASANRCRSSASPSETSIMACAPPPGPPRLTRAGPPAGDTTDGRRHPAPRRAARAARPPSRRTGRSPSRRHRVGRPSATRAHRRPCRTVPSTVTATTSSPADDTSPPTIGQPLAADASATPSVTPRASCPAAVGRPPIPRHPECDQRTERRGTHGREVAQRLHQRLPTHVGR